MSVVVVVGAANSLDYELSSLKLRCCFYAIRQSSVSGAQPVQGSSPFSPACLARTGSCGVMEYVGWRLSASCPTSTRQSAVGKCFADNFLSQAKPKCLPLWFCHAICLRRSAAFSNSRFAERRKHRDGHAHHTPHTEALSSARFPISTTRLARRPTPAIAHHGRFRRHLPVSCIPVPEQQHPLPFSRSLPLRHPHHLEPTMAADADATFLHRPTAS